jgi:hypothetical protein
VATLTTTTLTATAGTFSLTATYGGDTNYETSTSAAVSFTVSGMGSTKSSTALTASPNPVIAGANVTLTATVASGSASSTTTPTGSVTFYDSETPGNPVSLGSTTLNSSGVAKLTTSFTTGSTPSITATYSGDTNYASSTTANATTITVSAVGTTVSSTTLAASSTSPIAGVSVTLTATVPVVSPNGTPTGTVTFYDSISGSPVSLGDEALTAGAASAGVATLTTSFTATGKHSIKAVYGGDVTYAPSTSAPLDIIISASYCGFQDNANSVFATAADGYSSGANTLTSPSIQIMTANDESAICAENSGTTVAVTAPTIFSIFSGSVGSNADDSGIYGTNAAVLAYGSGSATASGGSITVTGPGGITTTGQYGNGVFASGPGAAITLSGVTISTQGADAHAGVAAEGGALTLTSVTASTTGQGSSALATNQGGGTVTATGSSITATTAEAVVVEGAGSVTLTGTTLSSSQGDDRGILLYQETTGPKNAVSAFSMTNGSISYTCDATKTAACATGNTATGQSNPATVFAVANTTATISLTDVTVTNDTQYAGDSQGTLLTAAALNSGTWGAAGSNGGNVTLTAYGTALTGDVIVDANSTVSLTLNEDAATTPVPSSLTGAINAANSGSTKVSLTLDATSTWVVTADSFLTALTNADSTNSNITCQTAGCTVTVGTNTISPK